MKLPVLIAALSGGVVAAILFEGSNRQKVCVLLVGALTSVFVTPYVCERLGITSHDALSFAGFLTGVNGYSLVKLLSHFVERNADSALSQFLGKLLGVPLKGE